MEEGRAQVRALPANLIAVPPVKQATDFSCGAAATLSLLRYWRWDTYRTTSESTLYEALRTTDRDGTEPEPILEYLRAHAHLEAEYHHDDGTTIADLERAVDAGEPPIVDLQAWRDRPTPWRDTWDAGHYVVLVGYDADHLYVMDPSVLTPGPYAFLPRAELDERWHDLAGPEARRLERMVLFVRGAVLDRWRPEGQPTGSATRLG